VSFILFDAGNSCLKLAIIDNFNNSDICYSILGYSNLQDDLINEIRDTQIEAAIVCNVNNPIIFHIISDVIYKFWHIEARLIIVEQDRYDISTRYDNPRLLGADRWLAIIAAYAEFHQCICVIDCGTAVTIDIVTKEGIHLGGLITPGLASARESLGLQGNNLPLVNDEYMEDKNKSTFLAITTQDAILGGTLYQLTAYIERIVSEIKLEFGDNIECIITGGDAKKIQSLILHPLHYREKLVLDGLKIVAKDYWFDKEYL
jgi:type III pantothenate kinase